MAEENKKQEAQPQPTVQPAPASQPQPQSQPSPKQGMSSGAKWGIGIGGCCCCLIIIILVILLLGFAGCSMFQFGGLGRYNWPSAPSIDEGTEIPIPSFSDIPR